MLFEQDSTAPQGEKSTPQPAPVPDLGVTHNADPAGFVLAHLQNLYGLYNDVATLFREVQVLAADIETLRQEFQKFQDAQKPTGGDNAQ